MESFIYIDLKGLIEIDTLGPGKKFYYRVQKPISINMSNYACKIMFFDIAHNLLYHRQNVLAHWLEPWQKIELVKWSKQGNLVYFYEYKRNEIYESVFVNLRDKYCFRIDEMKNNFEIVKKLSLRDREFNEHEVIAKLQGLELQPQPLIEDEVQASYFDKLLNLNKWHPSV
jgi:hypothetical protein